jgi:hypothetical protein
MFLGKQSISYLFFGCRYLAESKVFEVFDVIASAANEDY